MTRSSLRGRIRSFTSLFVEDELSWRITAGIICFVIIFGVIWLCESPFAARMAHMVGGCLLLFFFCLNLVFALGLMLGGISAGLRLNAGTSMNDLLEKAKLFAFVGFFLLAGFFTVEGIFRFDYFIFFQKGGPADLIEEIFIAPGLNSAIGTAAEFIAVFVLGGMTYLLKRMIMGFDHWCKRT